MSNDIVPIGQQIGQLSASMRQRMAVAAGIANKSFTSGVTASYPLLSIRGKEFTFRLPDGRTARHEQNGFAMPYIDVILVDASPLLSKAYYEKGFDPSEFTRPQCWSLDALKPDPSAPDIQSLTCGSCKQNEFGSKITDAGKKAKACQDHRRMVVLLPQQVGTENPTPLAMRVPQSSLKNLKAHAELLNNYGVDTKACITRMSFTNEAFPQLAFTYVNLLSEQEWDWIQELSQTSKVRGMLETPDFEQAVSTPAQDTKGTTKGLTPLVAGPPTDALDKLLGDQPAEEEEEKEVITKPVVEARAPAPSTDVIIDLPDGRRYNTTTKQYIEAEPEPEVPAEDPDVIELPDGKFFNTRTKQYVATIAAGAETVDAPVAKPKPKPRVKKAEAPVLETQAEVKAEAPKTNGAAATGSAIVPAPDALEAMLRDVLPPANK